MKECPMLLFYTSVKHFEIVQLLKIPKPHSGDISILMQPHSAATVSNQSHGETSGCCAL